MSSEITYVIGHKNPDTDSICSAIALAELRSAEGHENVYPARAGDINPQTAFILGCFDIEPPRYLSNVFPRARDIMTRDILTVTGETPLIKVMDLMRSEKIRFVPVVNEGGVFTGVLTLMDLAKRYMATVEDGWAREVYATIEGIRETLGAEVKLDFLGEEERKLGIYVGAMSKVSFSKILGSSDPKESAVIVGDRRAIQKKAAEDKIALIIISGGFEVDDEIIEIARKNKVSLIVSPFDSATTALLVRLSTPAHRVSCQNFNRAEPDELVEDLSYRLTNSNGMLILDDDGRILGIITKSNVLEPSKTKLILVDHNELSQAVDGAEDVSIVGVVDHHRIGNFNSAQAIPFICDPVGATSTLVSELYKNSGKPISKKTAGLLLGGVLSDTVILKSPTTTDRDRDIVLWLEGKSGLGHRKFGEEIFAATSSIKKRGAKKVVGGDHKVFEIKGKNFGIGQVETIGFNEFYEEKAGLTAELLTVKEDKRLELSAVLITDIVHGTSLLLAVGEKKVIYQLGYPMLEDNVFELKNVISRKKQVVPHILSVFNEIY